jgi:DUF917 family protein
VTLIEAADLPALARGCSVLGAGGGGDTQTGVLAVGQAIEQFGPVRVVDLDELPDDGLVIPCGLVGAPMVALEKVGSATEGEQLLAGLGKLIGGTVVALMPLEIGGSNGLRPIGWAVRAGLPIADADGMGRAFPKVSQVTMEIAGVDPSPSVLTEERSNLVAIWAQDGESLERIARALSIEFGGRVALAEYPMTAAQARAATARGSITLAVRIGRAMAARTHASGDPIQALERELDARRLIEGRIVDVERRMAAGFVRGAALIEGLRADSGRAVRLEIQNENLVALEGDTVRAMVPDVIVVLDSHSGEAIHTERLRYGQRVTVAAFPCNPIWRTPRGLTLTGPRAFGYEFDYVPLEQLQ